MSKSEKEFDVHLLSLRRKGNQLNLGILLVFVFSVQITILTYFAFESLDSDTQAELSTWRNVIFAIGIISFLIGIFTLYRLVTLGLQIIAMEVWIRRMGEGDLDHKVEMKGDDEVAALAQAIEKLRQRSISVVRLNLVETLANDLQKKNYELEQAVMQLNRAQDQMIARQKLSELGELASGVAHEIKNPLNFIRNFSEAIDELIVEIREAIDELDEEDREDISEIVDDIQSNLMRIEAHGLRADRIVTDLQALGGGGGVFAPAYINEIVSYFASLARNRSSELHPDLQLVLHQDLDLDIGEVIVIGEDLGRVVLNLVNNSCYATNAKRAALAEQGVAYTPEVWLQTKGDGDTLVIRVRDNGTGIEPEIMERVFNPFFTTKPTDQGTGLGLSFTNDTAREHGGTIELHSEPGEFTEVSIKIPLRRNVRSDEDEEVVNDPTSEEYLRFTRSQP